MTTDDPPTEREMLPDECQLCRPMDYRGDEINPPGGIVTTATDGGGTKLVHCCKRCADDLFEKHDFAPYTS